MPSAIQFILKDSPPEVLAVANVEPKGRMYTTEYSMQPGAVRIEDLTLAMKLASLAITDDKEDTLKKVGKTNPWHIKALTIITGSEEEAHKPLSHILENHFNLCCDTIIDVHGRRGRYFVDTQGYIAHNDEMIVLSYRCTTSGFDWLTNLSTTSSEWEPDIDIDQGHSGHFSCVAGCCRYSGVYKPRVHTGFYNGFLVSASMIQEYINPLLAPDQPPRKLYVVGHSLGAAVATMAACYFLTEFNWAELPHKLVHVTAGSPRAVLGSMQSRIHEEMKKLRPLDKAVICRIVRDKDVVPTVPPEVLGFRHLDKLVYITDDGKIIINPNLGSDNVIDTSTMNELLSTYPALMESEIEEAKEEGTKTESTYDKRIRMVPRAFRDHMPDFYLVPLIKLFEREVAGDGMVAVKNVSVPSESVAQ
jgi:pimeloyl-ACP methyl ester carboxylesterase